ncbi:MAG TPA: carboxypeptidase-like regulatory domain-containing protein [Kofleriaceae bacterium]|nr:carboxypeptidase-like regulatory domain-containing protein [Kofleriaceae bacterium]
MRAVALLACATACGGPHKAAPFPGGERDDGAGELAKQSIQLVLGGDDRAPAAEHGAPRAIEPDDNAYGGDGYGGAGYGNWAIPQWSYSTPNRVPRYNVAGALTGAIEGTVTWTGARPGKLATACGTIDNPTLHVGPDRALRGVLVYIEKVAVGRALPYYGRPASVGGVVVKRGCALVPSVQPVTPLPSALAIYGDATPARVRVASAGGPPRVLELQEAGIAQIEATPGVTRVDGEDGKLVAAWVIGIDSPDYALTDDAGRFRIDELAAGTYDVTFWQAPVAASSGGGTFAYGPPNIVHRSVRVAAHHATRVDVALPGR